jgi:alanine racemase
VLPTHPTSPTRSVVDLRALTLNLQCLRALLAPSCKVIGIVKANAYGHGAVAVSRALARAGVTKLGVATLTEGVQLREAGVGVEVIVMGPLVQAEIPDLVANRLTPVIYSEAFTMDLAMALRAAMVPYPVHVEVETGMGRLGVDQDRLPALLQSAAFKGPLRLEGLMSHFADADSDNPSYTQGQLAQFTGLLERVRRAGVTVPLAHMANTAGMLRFPASHLDAVRPGIGLYGYQYGTGQETVAPLRQVLSLATQIVQIRTLRLGETVSYNCTFRASRPTRIGVLPIGYADGYNRLLSNKGVVLIGGKRVPVVGRICMDMTMVDVTDVLAAHIGADAVLIGEQDDERITALDLAGWQGTIPYEVLCAIGPRVPRLYVE